MHPNLTLAVASTHAADLRRAAAQTRRAEDAERTRRPRISLTTPRMRLGRILAAGRPTVVHI